MQVFRRALWGALVVGLIPAASLRAVDPNLLPADTEFLFSINIRQAIDSDVAKNNKDLVEKIRQDVSKKIEENGSFKKFITKAGIDLGKNIDSVTVASDGSQELDSGFIVLSGSFDSDKIYTASEEAAKESNESFKISKLGDHRMMEITVKNEKTVFASVIRDKHLVAAPTKEQLVGAIGRLTAAKVANFKPSFRATLATLPANPTVSIVATADAFAKMVKNNPRVPAQVIDQLANFEGASFGISLGKKVEMLASINAKDADSAMQTKFLLDFVLGTLKGQAQNAAQADEKLAPLAAMAKTLVSGINGSTITIRGEATQENIEALVKLLPKN